MTIYIHHECDGAKKAPMLSIYMASGLPDSWYMEYETHERGSNSMDWDITHCPFCGIDLAEDAKRSAKECAESMARDIRYQVTHTHNRQFFQ